LTQERFFRQYGNPEGLDHPFIYSLCQDSDAYLWIGTGEGLYRFDGLNFDYFTVEQGLQDNFISQLFVDSEGNLWIGHQNGSLTKYAGGKFEIIYEGNESTGMIIDIIEAEKGEIWLVAQQEGLLIRTSDHSFQKALMESIEEPLSCLHYIGQNLFLLGTQNELLFCKFNKAARNIEIVNRVEDYPGSRITDIVKYDQGRYLIASQEEGIFYLEIQSDNGDHRFGVIDANEMGELDNLQAGLKSRDGSVWFVSMGMGVWRYKEARDSTFYIEEHIDSNNGLISENARCIFEDREGNIWIGMFGEGILKYEENGLTFFRFSMEKDLNRVRAVMKHERYLWIVEEDRLFQFDPISDSILQRKELTGIPKDDQVYAGFIAEDGRIWLGMEQSGLYTSAPGRNMFDKVFISSDELSNSINFIQGKEDEIWIATKKGLCSLHPPFERPQWFTSEEGLPHNNIQHICIDRKGRVLLATLSNEIFYIDSNRQVASVDSSNFGSLISMTSIEEDETGAVWVASQGNGLWKVNESGMTNYTKESGLISDYCYSLLINKEGPIIVAHRGGLSSIDTLSGRVNVFGRNEGINSSIEFYPNTWMLDEQGMNWFGTSDGLLKFKPVSSYGGMLAPKVNIKRILVDGEEFGRESKEIALKPGVYEIVIEYVGIHLSNPEGVLCNTILEGYSKEWSELNSTGRAIYDRVGHGEYDFKILAFNENGVQSQDSYSIKFRIKKAFYLRAWFYIAIFLAMSAVFYMILRIRERQQIQLQEYLKKELDERTVEVVAQKEKIEDINREITKSINYAQRIQASIMPSIGLLEKNFSDSFVFYLPRNIVSGDFYWYTELDNETSVLVCADSTGHGVPGAFMSMIGITLLKDICANTKLETPGELLHELDREVKATLNQNIDSDTPPDGMDIVAAFYKRKSKKLSIAGAMNPVVLFQDATLNYIRGSSFSIGGRYEDIGKKFETKEFTMKKGDKVYLFSDGYIDQFGGPRGKKFKSSGLRNLLTEIHYLPMKEQSKIMESNFMDWMGELEQIDDVVFIGIEI
jgi:ligand-binding sensor domain-containing protein/serine phosphatase RsbU (regulator of sigma subunit)